MFFDLTLEQAEDRAKINALTAKTPKAECPSMIIVDEAQLCERDNPSKLRSTCQLLEIPLVAVGTFRTIAYLKDQSLPGYSPITTDNVYQLPPFSQAEISEFFLQACAEFKFTLGRGVESAIYHMSGGNVGFIGIVGSYLVKKGWAGHTFLLMNYFRA